MATRSGAFGGSGSQDVERREGDAEGIRWRGGRRAQERHVEGLALRLRQVCHWRLEERPEQVAERGKCEARLDLARLRGDDAKATFPGSLDPGRPERGLADPRLAGEQQQPGASPDDRVEEILDLVELRAAAQD